MTSAVPPTIEAGRRTRLRRYRASSVEAIQLLAQLVVLALGCMVLFSLLVVPFGWRPYVVLSASMTPCLRVGDVVITAPARSRDISPGRVVAFPQPGNGRIIIHRIQQVRPDGRLVTQGDVNVTADTAPISPSTVRGVARLRLPMIALAAYWWSTRDWPPLIGSVVLLLILITVGWPKRSSSLTSDAGPDATRRT